MAELSKYKLGPMYTPPSLQGTVVMPGAMGGSGWGGAALDPETGWLYVKGTNSPALFTLKQRAEKSDTVDAPYMVDLQRFSLGGSFRDGAEGTSRPAGTLPINRGPYGNLTAINSRTGETIWELDLGQVAYANPMTYWSRGGRQLVVIATGPARTETLLRLRCRSSRSDRCSNWRNGSGSGKSRNSASSSSSVFRHLGRRRTSRARFQLRPPTRNPRFHFMHPFLRAALIVPRLLTFIAVGGSIAMAQPVGSGAAAPSVVLRTSRMLDGVGAVRQSVDIVVANGRITRIQPSVGALPSGGIDLRGRTVLPGLIDTHVHLGWYLNAANRLHQARDGDTPAVSAYNQAGNAWATLYAGFTTVQSVGEPENGALRDAINRGVLPGPRVLTSLGSLNETTGGGSIDSLRAAVRRFKIQGADLIKVFASKSIRDGGEATMTNEQLLATCGEAKAQSLRTLVHAHSAEAVQRAARAGCTQVEHGVFADSATRALLVLQGTFFDPQCGLVFHNYLDNKQWFEGIGNYNAAGFSAMENALPLAEAGIGLASRTPNLKLVFGTDAVAGAHGRNAEELVCRVRRGGQSAMDAIVSATSRAAESLGLQKEIGRIAVGFVADIIATDGDPSQEIEASGRVSFVMRGGHVYRNDAPRGSVPRVGPSLKTPPAR